MDNGQVLYVDKRNAAAPIEMFSSAGKVGPAYCTGVGKAMLAFLPDAEVAAAMDRQSFHRFTPHTLDSPARLHDELREVRRLGYALDREEHEPGIICCAVPILGRGGRVIGALSVTSITARSSLATLEAQAARLKEIAGEIAAAAGDWHFPEQG